MKKNKKGPKILFIDIETSPMLASVWDIWDQNVPLNMIERDWNVISFAAKWAHKKTIIQMDQRNAKNIQDDKKLLQGIWNLLDEADIVVGQNSNQFDIKKLNARFILNGMQPPSSYRKIDTKLLAQRFFKFTSNKLEYLSDKLNKKYKKLKHEKFSGFSLWTECLKGNKRAWQEMSKYNKYDVLALEELYYALIPWDSSINFNVYIDEAEEHMCSCGSTNFKRNGYDYTNGSKFQRYKCLECGAEVRDKNNLFSTEKKASLKVGIKR